MNTPLTRSRSDKFLGGVCAVLLAVFTQIGWIAYLVLWAVLPVEGGGPTGIDEAKRMFTSNNPNPPADPNIPNGDDLR